jgi:hypothetical protein
VQQRRARHALSQRVVDLILTCQLTPKEHPEEWAMLMRCFRPRGQQAF